MPLILGTNSIKDTGYNVANSLRFDRGSSTNLTRTPSGASNRKTFTWSLWFKRAHENLESALFCVGSNPSSSMFMLRFDPDKFNIYGHGSAPNISTNALFRDPSAWHHVVVAVDTTQSSASNRVKLYVNGTQITSFSTETYPSQDADLIVNSTTEIVIGERPDDNAHFSGYIAELVFIDGTALAPTSFGEFDEDSPTIWKPKDVSGLTFGTNGFYLDFENASSLGADVSGNSNNFTVNNLTSIDQTTDTCTNNFATLNPLAIMNNINQNHGDLSEGNLKIVGNSTTNNANAYSTIGVTKGKWYMETKILGTSTHYPNLGIVPYRTSVILVGSGQVGADTVSFAYKTTGQKTNNTDSSYGDSFTTNDIIGIAVDMDNGAIYFSKNGTFQASGDPTSGATKTNPAFSFTPLSQEEYFFAFAVYKTDSGIECNFGSPSYSISSGNSDAEGFGNFEYAVPSGYFALCTKNLAEYG